MRIEVFETINAVPDKWNNLIGDNLYLSKDFLSFIEINDKCNQKYYMIYDDEDKLDVFLVQQGTYLKNVLKNDAISKFTIAKCWQDFDNFYGTNYAEAVNKKIQHSKILNECIGFLDQLDGLLVDD